MKRKTYILLSMILTAVLGSLTVWNFSANTASAQKSDADENLGVVVVAGEYNARNEFALTQGGTSGVWRYGSTANDASNAFVPYSLTNIPTECGAPAERWYFSNSGDTLPEILRFLSPTNCLGTPTDSLYVHPGSGGQRTVLRWVAPASGTYQLTGALQRANPNATTDIRILKNETGSLFTGNINNQFQQAFNLNVTVAANDMIDFSVGFGNTSYNNDGSTLNVTVAQAATACLSAPTNLQVFVPGENSPADVQSVNTNASLVGDTTYNNLGKVGRSFEFDGSGDYVRIEDNAAQRPATAVTAEGWFKFDNTSGIVSLISKPIRGSALNSYTLYLEGGQLRGLIGNASQFTRALSSFAPQTGVWHHLAFTYDYTGGVSTLKLYANGVEVTSGVDGTANLPLFYDANPFPLLIGGEFENNAPTFFLDGQADEVSVYGRALSQNELFDIVQQGSFGKCSPGSACTQAPSGLVSWYRGEGNALDSVSNNNGALQNGTTFQPAKAGQGFKFDGVDDRVEIPDSPSQKPQALTVETWVKFDSLSSNTSGGAPNGLQYLVFKKNQSVGNFEGYSLLKTDANKLRIGFAPGNGNIGAVADSTTFVTAGVFYHVVGTYDGSAIRLYVNGQLESTTPYNLPLNYDTRPLFLGTSGENFDGKFNGVLDEVSIYNRAITAAEVSALSAAGQNGKCLSYVCAQTPNNLISWFAGEQNALDSRSNNHGTLQNGATFRAAKVGQGFKFDGADDYVEIPDSPSLNPQTLTVETWVKFDSLTSTTTGGAPSGYQNIIFKKNSRAPGTGFEGGYSLVKNPDNKIGFGFNNSGGGTDAVGSITAVQAGQWYHVVGTHDGTNIRLYINGQLESAGAATSPIDYGTTPLYLGTAQVPFSGYFNGVLDETSIYNRALSASEISSIYNANSSGKCKPTGLNPAANLVGFWTGDGDARDFAGEDQNAANNGAAFAVGKVGQAFNFTADPQNVSIPDSAAMRPANFTIEAWTKSLDNGGTRHIFAKTLGTGVSDSYVFWVANGILNGAICQTDNSCFTISTAAPNTGEWHHVALSFDDATDSLRIYIDGVQAVSGTTALSIGYDTHPVLIGADYGNEAIFDSWRGLIDEVSFYDRTLTQSEIAAVYNAGAAGKVKAKTVSVLPPSVTKSKGAKSAVLLPPASVQLSDATVTFANLTSSGTISENGIDLGLLPALPPSVRFTGLAYDIRATAGYQQGTADDVQVCFNAPSLAALNFNNLRILHLENGAWVNRTAAGNTAPNLCTDNLTSLSPFVIVQALAPTAANVSIAGLVTDASGRAIGGVSVTLTDSQGRSVSARTNNFGRYSFGNVGAGDVYIVSVASGRYSFPVSSQAVNVQESVENIDFTASQDSFFDNLVKTEGK
jgi:hypothetical protein